MAACVSWRSDHILTCWALWELLERRRRRAAEALIKTAVNTAIWSPSFSVIYLFVFPRCRDAQGDGRGSRGVQELVTAERTCRPRTVTFWRNNPHVASCLTRGLLGTLSTLWFSGRLHCTPSWLRRLMQSLLSPPTSRIRASPAQLIALFFLFHKAHRVLCLSLLHPWPSRLLMTQGATVYPCYDLSDSISDLVLMPHVSRGGRVTRRKKKIWPHSFCLIYLFAGMLGLRNYWLLCLFHVLSLHYCTWCG